MNGRVSLSVNINIYIYIEYNIYLVYTYFSLGSVEPRRCSSRRHGSTVVDLLSFHFFIPCKFGQTPRIWYKAGTKKSRILLAAFFFLGSNYEKASLVMHFLTKIGWVNTPTKFNRQISGQKHIITADAMASLSVPVLVSGLPWLDTSPRWRHCSQ